MRLLACWVLCAAVAMGQTPSADKAVVQDEHAGIGLTDENAGTHAHTTDPRAQWYPEADLGLFIHWGIASVDAINISWPMRPGRALAKRHIEDPAERARIVRESDYNLEGRPNSITPNAYFAQAKDFNPQAYDPDKWMKAAAAAGFRYVVLTTRHHEGFALWPSAYGDFDTRNFMGGRDLLRPYVEAARHYGLKVGFYYSPPDWYFDRDYMNFMYDGGSKENPELPKLDGDLKPRTNRHSAADIARHQAEYVRLVNGQIEELLTRYGHIDLIWFDGRPSVSRSLPIITQERIRALQPGIVINPRLHGHGDFVTYERTLPARRDSQVGWAEFCNPWTSAWPYVEDPKTHQEIPYRAPGFVLGQLALCRSWGINYLLDVGPKSTGELSDHAYENMAIVAAWMKPNHEAIFGAEPLAKGESANVPATARADVRYLFAIPQFRNGGSYADEQLPATEVTLTLRGAAKPAAVTLLATGQPLDFDFAGRTLSVHVPASIRTKLVDVVKVQL